MSPSAPREDAAALLRTLKHWRDEGWLRPLDCALAQWLAELAPQAPASLLLAAALLAQLEGQGHTALDLHQLHAGSDATIESLFAHWPEAARLELRTELLNHPMPQDDGAIWGAPAGALGVVLLQPLEAARDHPDRGSSPLVLAGGLLYFRRHLLAEQAVARHLLARAACLPNDTRTTPDTHAVSRALDPLFPPRPPGAPPDRQREACALALRSRLTVLTGGPGTGKTYTAARLILLLQALRSEKAGRLRVALAAPTGKAAARLRASIEQALTTAPGRAQAGAAGESDRADENPTVVPPAQTLHALLGVQRDTRAFKHHAGNPLPLDLLLVDEASMVHLDLMASLLDALAPHTRLVLLGDADQLASVEAGSVLADLTPSNMGTRHRLAPQSIALTESRRFEGPIGQLAEAVKLGDADALQSLLGHGPTRDAAASGLRCVTGAASAAALGEASSAGYAHFRHTLMRRPSAESLRQTPRLVEQWARHVLDAFDGFRVLCVLREGPWGLHALNTGIEERLFSPQGGGHMPEWYEGRPVMVTRNDPQLGLFNGDIGVALRHAEGALRVYFPDGNALRAVAPNRLLHCETAFALTVHKSQGSEFGHVALVLPDHDLPLLTRELLYTGITRARQAFTLVAPQVGLLTSALTRRVQRVGGLRRRLLVAG